MTRLLVSVRDVDEARVALAAGVDLIDVKEPARGSLGRAEASTVDTVLDAVAGRVATSAALGELREIDPAHPPRVSPRLDFVKLGLAGCSDWNGWSARWSELARDWPPRVGRVAVVYADGFRAAAPPPAMVLDHAERTGCRALLLDTYDKSAGGLLDLWGIADVAQWVARVRRSRIASVIAGGLDARTIGRLLPLGPDYIAVRGAACAVARTGRIDAARIADLMSIIAGPARVG